MLVDATTPDLPAIAAVFESAGRIELRRLALPEPGAGEALVKVRCCTVCASDVSTWTGKRAGPPGVLGHEIVGEILRLGPGGPLLDIAGAPVQVGDRVTWAVVAACGACEACLRGVPQKCATAWKYGHQGAGDRPPGSSTATALSGGLASHCLLVRGTAIVRIPAGISDGLAATASCAVATIAAALGRAGDVRGRRVIVTGAGMLGLVACAMSRWRGAGEVWVVDSNAKRLETATTLGAGRVLTSADELRDAAAGAPADVLIECTGHPAVTAAGVEALGLLGRAVLVGAVHPQSPVPIDAERVVRRMLTITGVHNYAPGDLVVAMDFLEQHAAVPALNALVGPPMRLVDIAAWKSAAEAGAYPRVLVTAE